MNSMFDLFYSLPGNLSKNKYFIMLCFATIFKSTIELVQKAIANIKAIDTEAIFSNYLFDFRLSYVIWYQYSTDIYFIPKK